MVEGPGASSLNGLPSPPEFRMPFNQAAPGSLRAVGKQGARLDMSPQACMGREPFMGP